MTRNQIEYWKNVETVRSNLANEDEARRSNMARESENYRHNTASEKETVRHNKATELVSNNANLINAQKVQNDRTLGFRQLEEQTRSNQARERENIAQRLQSASIANRTISVDAARNAETARHNKSTELLNAANLAEVQRSNIARENETVRSNVQNEILKRNQVNLTGSQLSETQRHNRVNEITQVLSLPIQLLTSLSRTVAAFK